MKNAITRLLSGVRADSHFTANVKVLLQTGGRFRQDKFT